MKAWRGLAVTLGAVAIIASGWGAPRADDAPKSAGPSISDMMDGLEGQLALDAINKAVQTADVDRVTGTTALSSYDCHDFQNLTDEGAIAAKLQTFQNVHTARQSELATAAQLVRERQQDVLKARAAFNTALLRAPRADPEDAWRAPAAEDAWRDATKALDDAQSDYRAREQVFSQEKVAFERDQACAALARAALQAVSAASSAAAAAQPLNPATIHGVITFNDGNNNHWMGRYSMQSDGKGAFFGPITWQQAPADAGMGFQVGDQIQWTFQIQPSGDINDPNTVFGTMSGHIDPATRNGGGTFLGPCKVGPPTGCFGAWTATP
jgi:hypothetical protein